MVDNEIAYLAAHSFDNLIKTGLINGQVIRIPGIDARLGNVDYGHLQKRSMAQHWLEAELATLTVTSGHCSAITAIVGPPTYPAPMQQIFLPFTSTVSNSHVEVAA